MKLASVEKKYLDVHIKIFKYLLLPLHKLRCYYWNWRIPGDLDSRLAEWQEIDHRKDKSLSGRDFRFWYYLRKLKGEK